MNHRVRISLWLALLVSAAACLVAAPSAFAFAFSWGQAQQVILGASAETSVWNSALSAWEDLADQAGPDTLGGPASRHASVNSSTGAYANASAWVGQSSMGVEGQSDVADNEGNAWASSIAAAFVPFTAFEPALASGDGGGDVAFGFEFEGNAASLFGLGIFDQDMNLLTGFSEVIDQNDVFTGSLNEFITDPGNYYLAGVFIAGAPYEDFLRGAAPQFGPSSYSASMAWGTDSVPPPVPEPATWALLAGGLGAAIAVSMRRRRGSSLAATMETRA
jgi:hypothetical protein